MATTRKRGRRASAKRASPRARSGVRAGTKIKILRGQRNGEPAAAARRGAPAAADSGVPVAAIAAGGGPVTVSIVFGQAQHAKYTIQLFDPAGTTELTRQAGLNTDAIPDQFTLQASPAQLDQHLLQWSGAVSAFTPAPGQLFSIIVDVTQNGVSVPGAPVPRTGKLTVTQAFVGILRLVTR